MKAVQVMFDEELLERLDASEEVKREGRSAVLRRAVADYLGRRREERIADQYRRAYSDTRDLDGELEGWEEEGQWPQS